nr:probable transmembrane ascorbate ferrireductase 4 [Ipomoea batatas]
MAALLLSPFSLLLLARVSASIVALLVLTWAVHFQTSFIPHSPSQDDLIYAVLHPLLMVIGFILVSGEGSRNMKKSVHLCLQGVALGCGVFGIWTKFHSREGVVANFYSLHSWMGLVCISLFGAQFLNLFCAVDGWFPKLLAPRRGANDEDTGPPMACISWPLHIRVGSGDSRDWPSREVDFPADEWGVTEALYRNHGCKRFRSWIGSA